MKKITQNAINAFYNKSNFNQSNTSVIYGDITGNDVSHLYLFNNHIAQYNHDTKVLKINLCGWGSVTTRERLNGLSGVSIGQTNFIQYLNGVELVDLSKWHIIKGQ